MVNSGVSSDLNTRRNIKKALAFIFKKSNMVNKFFF